MDVPPVPMVVAWGAELPAGALGTGFALAEGRLSVVSVQSASPQTPGPVHLSLYRPTAGEPVGVISLGSGWAGSPAIGNGKVYVAVYRPLFGGTLYAFSLEGSPAWSVPIEAGTIPGQPVQVPSPVLFNGQVWLPGTNGNLLRWDADSGAAHSPLATGLQSPPGGTLFLHAPAVTDQGVFAAAHRQAIYGAPIENPVWRAPIGGNFTSPPVVNGGFLFVAGSGIAGGNDSGVAMINANTGALRWNAPMGNVVAMAAESGTLFTADIAGYVTAMVSRNGSRKWVWNLKQTPLALINAGGFPVVGDVRGVLHVLDPLTDREIWSFPTRPSGEGNLTAMRLLIAGGMATLGEEETFLYALGDQRVAAFRSGRYGDPNWDETVDINDVVLVLKFIVGLATLSPAQKAAVDLAPSPGVGGRPVGDGSIDISDVLSMLRKIAGLQPPTWPVTP